MAEDQPTTAPAESPPPVAAPAASSDERTLLHWKSVLPETLREDPNIRRYNSLRGLAEGHVHLNRLLGSSVQIPKPDAAPEAWNEFYGKLGRPATPDEYSYDPKEHLPEGVELQKDFEQQLRKEAHDWGLTPAQFQKVIGFAGRFVKEQDNLTQAEKVQARLDGQKALAKKFGPEVLDRVEEAQQFFSLIGEGVFGGIEDGEAAWQKLVDAGLTNDPDVVSVFSHARRRMMEARFHDSELYPKAGLTPDMMREQARALKAKQMAGTATDADLAKMKKLYDDSGAYMDRSQRRAS